MIIDKVDHFILLFYTFVILFISQLNFANELDSILLKARDFGKKKNYTEAIKAYESYIKNAGDENLNIKRMFSF